MWRPTTDAPLNGMPNNVSLQYAISNLEITSEPVLAIDRAAPSPKGLRLRTGCAVQNSSATGCYATGSAASVGLAPFVAAYSGPLPGSAIAQPAASPHGAVLSRPRAFPASFPVPRCLSNQGRWSATQHNAGY